MYKRQPVDNTPHYVQKEVVYVRVGPGQNHDIEGIATFGLKLVVLEKGSEWSKVRTETGITGYMRNDLFDVNVPVRPEPVAPPAPVDLYVKAKVVNLREQPSENSAVIIYPVSYTHLSLGIPPRSCLLCDQSASMCARSHAHSKEALHSEIKRRLEQTVAEEVSARVAARAVEALSLIHI